MTKTQELILDKTSLIINVDWKEYSFLETLCKIDFDKHEFAFRCTKLYVQFYLLFCLNRRNTRYKKKNLDSCDVQTIARFFYLKKTLYSDETIIILHKLFLLITLST